MGGQLSVGLYMLFSDSTLVSYTKGRYIELPTLQNFSGSSGISWCFLGKKQTDLSGQCIDGKSSHVTVCSSSLFVYSIQANVLSHFQNLEVIVY